VPSFSGPCKVGVAIAGIEWVDSEVGDLLQDWVHNFRLVITIKEALLRVALINCYVSPEDIPHLVVQHSCQG
jgi:hypothetical protein